MSKDFDWGKDYFHKDPFYGLNDWEPVVDYIRALMEDSEVAWCWDYARKLILRDNTLLSQTLIQHIGFVMQDERGIDIIQEKLVLLGRDDRTIASPWNIGDQCLEMVCLKALANIGGEKVKNLIKSYLRNPEKAYLEKDFKKLKIVDKPRPCVVLRGDDFPEVLKGIHSINDILRVDQEYGGDLPDVLEGTEEIKEIIKSTRNKPLDRNKKVQQILKVWRNFSWPGPIEYLSGDGETTTFKLKNKITDHIHNFKDPFSDFGIFRSDPKIEYPIGTRRWAVSHTFLYFQVPDGGLYDKEYTWDFQKNTITTHFHTYVAIEKAMLNPDGKSITVSHTPISTGVEVRGNTFTKLCSSAVRGIWDNPNKQGKNYYVRRGNVLTPYKHLCYFRPLHTPIVKMLGAWLVEESEHPEQYFDSEGNCIDINGVVEELLIPLHEPKVLAWSRAQYYPMGTEDKFGKRLPQKLWPELTKVPSTSLLEPYLGVPFIPHHCGVAGWEQNKDNGYRGGYDINSDGIIDEKDKEILIRHEGKVYRKNMFDLSYFGINWFATSYGSRSKNFDADPPIYICSYDYGAGYDSVTGRVNLFEIVPSGKEFYVEYYYDAPSAEGKDNIRVYLHEAI